MVPAGEVTPAAASACVTWPRVRPYWRSASSFTMTCTSRARTPETVTLETPDTRFTSSLTSSPSVVSSAGASFPETDTTRIGWSAKLTSETVGVVASLGRSLLTLSTASFKDWMDLSIFALASNSTETVETPSFEEEVTFDTCSMPSTPLSILFVTRRSTSAEDAPGSAVTTIPSGMEISGVASFGMLVTA